MRRFVELVFDDFIFGVTDVYTSPDHDLLLGSTSRFSMQAVTDKVTGSTVSLSVRAEHSIDGRRFTTVAGTNEIDRVGLSSTSTTVANGVVATSTPRLRRVRLKLTLAGSTPGAHVRLYATGRDKP